MVKLVAFGLTCLASSSFAAHHVTRGNADTVAVCDQLQSSYPNYFAWDPLGPAGPLTTNASVYQNLNSHYWNAANSKLRATCAFFPGSAEQVSDVIKLLIKYPSVPFALKSGGHQPASGFSATDAGVLISFEPNLNSVARSQDGQHFLVGPGARWGEVYNVTGLTNQVVVGGRLANIGVGGLILGGGLSYYSAQYGLACDNVDAFEAVLSNGTVVTASASENADLWWALRGGGNQFAIITQLKLQAHPAGIDGRIWGGIRTYNLSKRRQLFDAITKFVRDYPDAKAAVIPTFQFGLPLNALNAVTGPIVFFFYDGPTPPAKVFADFDAIASLTDSTGAMSYSDLTSMAGGANLKGFGNSFREDTYQNMPVANMSDFYEMIWQEVSLQSLGNSLRPLDVEVMGFDTQPLSKRIAQASQAQGGNALGLKPEHGDRIWIENNLLWLNSDCNQKCPEFSREVSDKIKARHEAQYASIPPTNYESGDLDYVNYNPLFMNDVAPYQDPYTSYGAGNLAKLQAIKAKYDPTGFLTNRQGGFKLPAA